MTEARSRRSRNAFLQFNYAPYPLWRRRWPVPGMTAALKPLWGRYYPVEVDQPIPTLNNVSGYLTRYGLLPGVSEAEIRLRLMDSAVAVDVVDMNKPPAITDQPIRLPAQWEPMERVMLSWPVSFPPLWAAHAEMAEQIAVSAPVQINVPHPIWASAIAMYLLLRGKVKLERIKFYDLPTNDLWVRDYGPVVGITPQGTRAAVSMIFDPLPNYPQALDNALPEHWAAHEGMPVHPLALHNEGGNIWSDGAGTLMMSEQVFAQNPDLDRTALEAQLHSAFTYDKLLILPRMRYEETGHVDLVTKLATADTVLVSSPHGATFSADRLIAAKRQLQRESNAKGARYTVIELPTPPLYMNWFGYPVRRSYTNALTVNGRVLVPVFKHPHDELALRRYQEAMPGIEVVPIDSSIGANGGGAVHCMTKEIAAGG
ncbi:MAG: agmatine deiminase family protein [Phototrophicaceae bacterium]|jgi:agmatine deiminase